MHQPALPTRAPSGSAKDRVAPAILCIGPLCVDHLKFQIDRTERFYPGGNAVIFSATSSMMGIPTTIAGQVGADAEGELIRDCLRSHGVDVTGMRSAPAIPTKVSRNVIRTNGDWYRESVRPEFFNYLPTERPAGLHQFTHLHVGGLNGLLNSVPDACARFIRSSRKHQLAISIGLASRQVDQRLLEQTISDNDILFCTDDEFCRLLSLTSNTPEAALAALIDSRFANCIVTLGPLGAIAKWRASELYHVDAYGLRISAAQADSARQVGRLRAAIASLDFRSSVLTPLNTIGAGDIFSAVFMAMTVSNQTPEAALRGAAKAASLSIQHACWDGWLKDASSTTAQPLWHHGA